MKLVCTLKEQLGIIHTALCNYPYYQNSITYKRSEYDYAKIHLLNSDPKQLINIEDVYLELIKQGNSLKFVNNEDYEYNALLNLDTIKKNWKYIPMELIFTFVNGEYDGDSSDSLIQYLLYKEVLFG